MSTQAKQFNSEATTAFDTMAQANQQTMAACANQTDSQTQANNNVFLEGRKFANFLPFFMCK